MAGLLEPIYGRNEARQMIRMLFEHFCDISFVDLVLLKERSVSPFQIDKLQRATTALQNHVPVQYIIGYVTFSGIKLEVNQAVLIPRSETEELIELIMAENHSTITGLDKRLLDIGTGSGCIAIALEKYLGEWETEACDVSEEALRIAERNAKQNEVNIHFFEADILRWKEWKETGLYSIIVSNPPYVCENEKTVMQANVLEHEPALALFVPDDNPLIYYRAIAGYAAAHLTEQGRLYLEINENYGPEIIELLKDERFAYVQVHKDFRGKDRFAIAAK